MSKLAEIVESYSGRPIAVVGDLILDEFVWGSVERISPEAPVPVVRAQRRSFHLGGAANVAANLHSLGADPQMVGVVGDDQSGHCFLETARAAGLSTEGVVVEPGRQTTLKTRIVAHQQQVCRTDWESGEPLSPAAREALVKEGERVLRGSEAVVLSDYALGVLSDRLTQLLIESSRERSLFLGVDPKDIRMAHYRGAGVITPNRREAELAAGRPIAGRDDIAEVGRQLRHETGAEWILMTLGEQGMALIGADSVTDIPTAAREVFDVSGAGDTVVATLVLSVACGAEVVDACRLANEAAGIVVGKVGTAAVTAQELKKAVSSKG